MDSSFELSEQRSTTMSTAPCLALSHSSMFPSQEEGRNDPVLRYRRDACRLPTGMSALVGLPGRDREGP